MDFFEAQALARRRSRRLAILFAGAVLAVITAVYLVVRYAVGPIVGFTEYAGGFDPDLYLQVALGTGLVIAGGSLYRTSKLSQGGPVVAALLGGWRVLPNTSDTDERRFLNLVEEMAIASGTPVPAAYVLRSEDGINAFAAGYTLDDAAVAVTEGALRKLSRDELQGVIAHEFSHILNGDMRLNIRLIGMLHGILLLAVIGRGILRGTSHRSSSDRKGSGHAALFGAALVVIGYVGVFFGRLIKAAISREREFLADASAVQFTRNPGAVAGALARIGADGFGSVIRDSHAEEISHLLFAHGLRRPWFEFMATHPPLEERIRRIDPSWDGYFVPPVREPVPDRAFEPSAPRPGLGDLSALALVASIGAPTAAHVEHAHRLLASLPEPLVQAARSPTGAQALVLALLMNPESDAEPQRSVLRRYGGEPLLGEIDRLLPIVRVQPAEARLPLVDLAVPALRTLPGERSRAFRGAIHDLVRADGHVHLFEYALVHIVARQLSGEISRAEPGRALHSFQPIRGEVELVLSGLAWAGAAHEDEARASLAAALERLPDTIGPVQLQHPADCELPQVDEALGRIARTSYGIRRRFLDACAHAVSRDGRVRAEEGELLRAVAESLNCPMPPILAPAAAPVAPAEDPPLVTP